jgi:DNA helicase-2/ATP-dependent DNA helicase PcrA
MRVTVNPFDELSWKRILKLTPGIGNITAGRIWDSIKRSGDPLEAVFDTGRIIPKKALDGFLLFLSLVKTLREGGEENTPLQPSAAIDHILRHGYEDHLYSHYPNAEERIEDIEQMSQFSLKYTSPEVFISDMSLQNAAGEEAEGAAEDRECVILSTVHQAKGLEWKTVFIIGLNDGRFPSARALKTDSEEEERRLFYVAVTRAGDELYLCYPVTSEEWQGLGFLRPSRFIKELPDNIYEEIVVEDSNEIY